MPKEIIKTKFKNQSITVGWEKDRQAQVGVTLGSHFIFTDKNGKPLPEEDGQETYDSLWLLFEYNDREKFNELIRAVRKARDSVCGKDE